MTRRTTRPARLDTVSTQLREMFEAAEALPIPDRLWSVIDQLDEGEAEVKAAPAVRRAAGRATSG
ncbi:MAG: hypothetical protein WCY15_09105 [Phenylobacterium sp.]|jgi:hypothetical protein|uniref:hypothetical protein n=1 Tax=Phenylobacterium sp. TaxID=1871053 RepID=UPI002A3496EE|nr:hypothetical protein [Phenylobacterium sp.]MDD3837421.1 hypothetical protein [Phenylobacterium sp.]MDX9998325.1 hypothetical protein [Phenylobacterium sp.]